MGARRRRGACEGAYAVEEKAPQQRDTAPHDAYVDRARGRHAFSGMNVPTKWSVSGQHTL